MEAAELALNVRNTLAFIAANVSSITLTPQARTHGSGGVTITRGADKAPQLVRLIDWSSSFGMSQPVQRTIDGVERTVTMMMLGAPDADIDIFDTWYENDGSRDEITDVFPSNGYETRATVVRYLA